MCGIHLIIHKGDSEFDGQAAMNRMVESLIHRGPDGFSVASFDLADEKIWIGHNLLAISDTTENARQPLISSDLNCGIVFNGQIYNHKQLRFTLEDDGIQFETDSDTEVLMMWLHRYGRKGLRKLEGMYAFVYWDSVKQLLLIHRDGYGIKPLYFARNRHFFVVSSEPKAILSSGLFNLSIDNQAISYFLKYKFIPAPQSPWVGIKSFIPGEAIEYWEGKPMHYQVHNDISESPHKSLEEAIDCGFRAVISDREPVGLMLSGGVDSTLILTWCLKNKIDIIPFSIRFLFGKANQNPDQNSVAILERKYNLKVQWVDIELNDFHPDTDFATKYQPLVADSAWFLTDRIAKRASEMGIRILHSGGGADEWFGGYRRHWYYNQWQKLSTFIPERWQLPILKKLKMASVKALNDKELIPEIVWDTAVSNKLTKFLKESPLLPTKFQKFKISGLEAAMRWDQQQYLPNDILTITDAATMAHGIEGRFPFLHPAITQFADSFSAEERLEKGRKWMLAQMLERELKDDFITKRKKHGFGFPMSHWIESEEVKRWSETFLKENWQQLLPWFDDQALKEMLNELNPKTMEKEFFALSWLSNWLKENT